MNVTYVSSSNSCDKRKEDSIVEMQMGNGTAVSHSNHWCLDTPCLAMGLNINFTDGYLHCYPTCNPHPSTLTHMDIHSSAKHSRFKKECFVPLSGEL